jgi:hypothetical protein
VGDPDHRDPRPSRQALVRDPRPGGAPAIYQMGTYAPADGSTMDGQPGRRPRRQHGARLQRLERQHVPGHSLRPDGWPARSSASCPRPRRSCSPAPARRPAAPVAGATTARW